MDSVMPGFAVTADEAQQSSHPQAIHSSSNNTTPTKALRHHSGKQDSPPIKGSWNPFASLRGLKESKKKTKTAVTTRCKSSSPQKDDTSKLNEFGKRKTMRRKSLQDLLGAVSTKLSRGRRQVAEELANTSLENDRDEPILPIIVLSEQVELVPVELHESLGGDHGDLRPVDDSDVKLRAESSKECSLVIPSDGRTATVTDSSKFERNEKQAKSAVPALLEWIDYPNMHGNVDVPKSPKDSTIDLHDSTQISTTPSPGKFRAGECAIFLQNAGAQIQEHDTCLAREPLANDGLNPTIKDALSTLYVDTSFDTSSTKGKESLDSMRCEPLSSTTDLSSKEIAKHIILTTAKISENYHLSQNQDRRLIDNSESDADNVSHYSWDATHPEVWDVIEKGRDAVTKNTPISYFHSGSVPEISSTEAISDCSTYAVSFTAEDIPGKDSESFPVGLDSLSNKEDISADSIRVIHPRSGQRGPFTSRHASMSAALADLYQNYTEYSTYCLFDRANMILLPQPARGYLDTERPQQYGKGLEIIWLQMKSCLEHKTLKDPQEIPTVKCQDVPSAGTANSSPDGQYTPLLCVSEALASSIASGDQPEETTSACEIPEESATARLCSEGSFSSADSVNSSNLIDFHWDTTDSVRFEIDDVTQDGTRPLKTWADLGKEFLDRHAPGSSSSLELRSKIAVHEALKSRHAAAISCEYDQDLSSGSDCSILHDIEDREHEKYSHDREFSDDVTFDYVKDIGENESTKEEMRKVSRALCVQDDISLPIKSYSIPDISITSKTRIEAIRSAFRREPLADQKKIGVDLGSVYMNPMCPVEMYKTGDCKAQQDQNCQVPASVIQENCEGAADDYESCALEFGIRVPSPLHKYEAPLSRALEPVYADITTDKTSTGRPVLETIQKRREIADFRPQSLSYAEALSVSLCPPPRVSSSPTRTKASTYSPVIPSPLSGQKRVLTPGKRVLTPLANMYQKRNVEVRVPAPPPSEAETEESFDFGQELQRYGYAEEDCKENGDRQAKAFTLYGQRIHCAGLKDTV